LGSVHKIFTYTSPNACEIEEVDENSQPPRYYSHSRPCWLHIWITAASHNGWFQHFRISSHPIHQEFKVLPIWFPWASQPHSAQSVLIQHSFGALPLWLQYWYRLTDSLHICVIAVSRRFQHFPTTSHPIHQWVQGPSHMVPLGILATPCC